jgi:spermidine synthase
MGNLRQVFARVTPYFVHIPLYGSIWGFAIASDALDPKAVAPEEIDARLERRGVRDLQYYNGEIHRAVFALPNYVRKLVT